MEQGLNFDPWIPWSDPSPGGLWPGRFWRISVSATGALGRADSCPCPPTFWSYGQLYCLPYHFLLAGMQLPAFATFASALSFKSVLPDVWYITTWKCTKMLLRPGISVADFVGGAYSALLDHLVSKLSIVERIVVTLPNAQMDLSGRFAAGWGWGNKEREEEREGWRKAMGVDPWVDMETCPPTLKWRGRRPVFCPPTFWEQILFVIWRTPYFNSNTMHRCSMFIAAIFTKFSQLILRKIIKIVAIRCQILRLKCTKFDFGWGCAPDPTGELTALP